MKFRCYLFPCLNKKITFAPKSKLNKMDEGPESIINFLNQI